MKADLRRRGPLAAEEPAPPYPFCAVARIFWSERKVDMARKYFDRAVRLD
eukprot:gene4549-5063_t